MYLSCCTARFFPPSWILYNYVQKLRKQELNNNINSTINILMKSPKIDGHQLKQQFTKHIHMQVHKQQGNK